MRLTAIMQLVDYDLPFVSPIVKALCLEGFVAD